MGVHHNFMDQGNREGSNEDRRNEEGTNGKWKEMSKARYLCPLRSFRRCYPRIIGRGRNKGGRSYGGSEMAVQQSPRK